MAGGVNLYAYAGGNPVSYSDPYGLCPPLPACMGIAGAVTFGVVRAGANLLSGKPVLSGVGSDMAAGAAWGLTLAGISPAALGIPIASGATAAPTATRASPTLDRRETKFANLNDHLTPRDLLGALKDLGGIPSGGSHLQEVREAAAGVSRVIRTLNGMLQNPSLAAADRERASALLTQATEKLSEVNQVIK